MKKIPMILFPLNRLKKRTFAWADVKAIKKVLFRGRKYTMMAWECFDEKGRNFYFHRGHRRPLCEHKHGFTLIEALLVILTISILTGLVLGLAGFGAKKTARARAEADLEKLKTALEEYRLEQGTYPATNGVFTNASMQQLTNSLSNYVPNLDFVDPWGRSYQFERTTNFEYRIWSQGPDDDDQSDDIDNKNILF